MLNGVPKKSPWKKIARRSQVALKVMLVMFFSRNGLTLDPRQSMANITAHSWRIRWGWLFSVNNQNCLNMVSFLLQDSATLHRHCGIQNLVQHRNWEVLAHPPYFPDLSTCDYWLFAHVEWHFRGKGFELEEDVNTAATASLHHLSKDEYRTAAADRKSVWTVLVIALSRGYMYKHSGISVVLLSCVLLLQ